MKLTALNQVHIDQSAKMVEFANYNMPIQYQEGMLKEHEWVRSGNVGLFDVSHMGQAIVEGEGVAEFFSNITPTSFVKTKNSLAKYTVLTNEEGGIIDDLIITRLEENKFFIVINAACKEKDIAWIKKHLPNNITFTEIEDRSLIAVQGEKAESVLQNFVKEGELAELPYMNLGQYELKNGAQVFISRTGYTGEDGFEVSIENKYAPNFWTELCANEFVKPIGLGARDSLRLEVGYPLYGHDLDDTTSPVEAALSWVISKTNEKFIGCERIFAEKENGVKRKRVGVKLLTRGIAREGSEIRDKNGKKIGSLTSGGFSPNLKVSIGQGYVDAQNANIGEEVLVVVRGNELPAVIQSSVFVPARTKAIKKK
ncbi:MAG: glycine cleavage system aminomethyltransferase GcvT [Proteobacteria bacterium]|nr:glycine cleavage system aminomethyltransferase GcvT [Pseudomonadota bacterium]